MNNIKKYTQKDRYGGSQVFEFHVPEMNIPSKPDEGHPGDPRGTDTVPAWLTPGENVVNAEASRLPGNQQMIDQMNNQGRAIQKQQGGPIPSYEADGGQVPMYSAAGDFVIDDAMLDAVSQVESNNDPQALSGVGAGGQYQIMPATAQQPGYGTTPISLEDRFDPDKSRAFAKEYLQGIMAKHPDFTRDQVLTAYHSGAGNVLKNNIGPVGQAYAGKVNAAEIPTQVAMYDGQGLTYPNAQNYSTKAVPEDKSFVQSITDYFTDKDEVPSMEGTVDQDMYAGMNPREVQRFERGIDDDIIMDSLGNVQAVNPNRVDESIPQKLAEKFANDGNKKAYDYGLSQYKEAVKQDNAYKEDSKRIVDEENTAKEIEVASQVNTLDQQIEEAKKNGDTTLLDVLIKKKNDLQNSVKKVIPDVNKKNKTILDMISQLPKNDNKPDPNKIKEKEKTVIETDPTMVEKMTGWFTDAFSDMFSGPELARMAITYSASRVLGYDHGNSFEHAAKKYMTRVDSSVAARQTFVTKKDNLEEFTTKSLSDYRKSGNLNDLIRRKTGTSIIGSGPMITHNKFGPLPTKKIGKDKFAIQYKGQLYPYDHSLMVGQTRPYDKELDEPQAVQDLFYKRGTSLIKSLNSGIRDSDEETPRITEDAAIQAQFAADRYIQDVQLYGSSPLIRSKLRTQMLQAQEEFWKDYAKSQRAGGDVPKSVLSYYNKRAITPKTKGVVSQNDFIGATAEQVSLLDKTITDISYSSKDNAKRYRELWGALKQNWSKHGSKDPRFKDIMGADDDNNSFTYWAFKVLENNPKPSDEHKAAIKLLKDKYKPKE